MILNKVNKILLSILTLALVSTAVRANANQKWAGMHFQGIDYLNKLVVRAVEYVGECEGYEQEQVHKYTFKSHVEPAPGLEVLIENVTPGARTDKKKPYTVRKYNTAVGAEFAETKIHDHGKHGRKHLTLVPSSKNEFTYKIFSGDFDKKSRTVTGLVDEGTFYIELTKQTQTKQRDIQWQVKNYCKAHPTYTNDYGQVVEDTSRCDKENRYEMKYGYCDGSKVVAYDRQENKTGDVWADTVQEVLPGIIDLF